ncbi:hypothetical protein Mal64_32100 [Pseudobythopirellula maris]|uniref:Ice-binding protein C-terminal domain-containing protein n=1 Tax=Pseudobythopirellula maris TaxID=2527991 RepID=A0A5C5ZKI6_9BACT|nr:PEP-CTERM sorting domain-containing protein [Pseudobythopirellula maris]TWT87668.1 hypothetical protein Mal64_32100 [Pseudobythopirellula maris]
MNRRTNLVLALGACWLAAGVALADTPVIDGVVANERVFNDFPDSSLSTTNGNSVNGGPGVSQVIFDESSFGTGGFANRHDALLSDDGGATGALFRIDDSYTFKTDLTLDVGSTSPRKEAGLRINSPVTGDALFIVNSDAGEIVAFGGPFFSFNSEFGVSYTPGDTITMGFTLIGGGDGNGGVADTIQYFIDHPTAGYLASPALPWSNLELGPVNYRLGMYTQTQPDGSNANEFVSTTFDNIMFTAVPEPSGLALLGLGAWVAAGRCLRPRRR